MDEGITDLNLKKCLKTYVNRKTLKNTNTQECQQKSVPTKETEPLTTKHAIKFLLEGNLRTKVCRYCLNLTSELSELDQILHVGGKEEAIYKVTIKDMVASFHPFKVADDPNFPNKICDKCLDRTISAYLFTQQCEQAERALRNCFEDIHEKFEKLDPLERPRKRGRHKIHLNHNKLYTEHRNVIDYAEPLFNIINIGSETFTDEPKLMELECKKCYQVLPNVESLVNHEKSHPKSMWYNCRLCGQSFAKCHQLKKHQRTHLKLENSDDDKPFYCSDCFMKFETYNEYLQHKENHKFKTVMEHLIERKMNVLCSVCLDKGTSLTDLDSLICIHGPYPELSGDMNLYSILESTLPDMNTLYNYTGRKICKNCLNHAITSYIFINRARFVRNRLNTCVTVMLENLNYVEPVNTIFIEINQNVVCPKLNIFDENFLLNDSLDEDNYSVDILEDEFREEYESDEESISEVGDDVKVDHAENINSLAKTIRDSIENAQNLSSNDNTDNITAYTTINCALTETKNGYIENLMSDICSEFLTFNKKKKPNPSVKRYKFTCPVCKKQFISVFFLKRHYLKHINKKVLCKMCDDEFTSKFLLYEHNKMVHLLKTSYVACKTCGRTFSSQNRLRKHEKHHENITCMLCSKMFLSQKYYDNHMQRHFTRSTLKKTVELTCSFCEKSCRNDNELSVHVNKIHLQIKPYGCDMCDRLFYTEYNLRCHKRVHSIISKETCQFCSKTLKCRKQLVVHVRKHIGVKPYCCQICGQSFYSQYKQGVHMEMCHGGRYCCRICKCVVTTRTALKEHGTVAHGYI